MPRRRGSERRPPPPRCLHHAPAASSRRASRTPASPPVKAEGFRCLDLSNIGLQMPQFVEQRAADVSTCRTEGSGCLNLLPGCLHHAPAASSRRASRTPASPPVNAEGFRCLVEQRVADVSICRTEGFRCLKLSNRGLQMSRFAPTPPPRTSIEPSCFPHTSVAPCQKRGLQMSGLVDQRASEVRTRSTFFRW